jgi:hypothetical protein
VQIAGVVVVTTTGSPDVDRVVTGTVVPKAELSGATIEID